MAEITTSQIGNGTTAYGSDIVVKDLDLDVSNRVKDDTPVLNMCMSKKRKVNSTLPLWTDDIYAAPQVQAQVEGATVATSQAESNTRYNLGNYTQIFSTVIAASGTARAVMQAGGDPQAYQEVKQLIELMFDVELQLVRNDQIGTKYAGQTGTASGLPAGQTGRRMGSLASFAGSMSFNTTSGSVSGLDTFFNNEDTDSATQISNALRIYANGSYYYAGTFTNQVFSPVLYKQLVTVAEQRYNAKIRTMVAPTSLRTIISDNIVSSNTSVNRRNVERGDTIQTYEGDFNYTYEVYDSWIMDQAGVSNSIYFLNEDVLQWGALRDLGPNNEVFSNADASLDQFIMEGTLIVRNPAGVGMLNNITNTGSLVTALRPAAIVQRTNFGPGDVTP
jgi:hypothetical protein|tara:strand:+ start:451 stop:1620 length:1170 start_codon:yes stop_codon:yes gene_type:complete